MCGLASCITFRARAGAYPSSTKLQEKSGIAASARGCPGVELMAWVSRGIDTDTDEDPTVPADVHDGRS